MQRDNKMSLISKLMSIVLTVQQNQGLGKHKMASLPFREGGAPIKWCSNKRHPRDRLEFIKEKAISERFGYTCQDANRPPFLPGGPGLSCQVGLWAARRFRMTTAPTVGRMLLSER